MKLPMPSPSAPAVNAFTVDPDQLTRGLAALTDVGSAMVQVRLALAAVRAGAPGWAADGDLPEAVAGLVRVLDEAAARSQLDARDLADALRQAVNGYSDAERAAVAQPAPNGDAMAGSRR